MKVTYKMIHQIRTGKMPMYLSPAKFETVSAVEDALLYYDGDYKNLKEVIEKAEQYLEDKKNQSRFY